MPFDLSSPPPVCPVCLAASPRFLMRVASMDYGRCDVCEATFVPSSRHPAPESERAEYELHRNDPQDAGYRAFLNRLAQPLLARLAPASEGLDYGCGPGPLLADMLRAAGHRVALYDPFFAPDRSVLQRSFDFVTCTEVVEHFHRPAEEFARLDGLLRPGGWLAIMTCFQTDDARFARWHYRRDPTHVVFYRETTFRVIASQYGWVCEIPAKDVVLMRKPVR